jgi:hypothetical protein
MRLLNINRKPTSLLNIQKKINQNDTFIYIYIIKKTHTRIGINNFTDNFFFC